MRWELVPGLSGAGATAAAAMPVTLYQQVSGASTPSPGFGSFLARCAAGPACNYFSSGSQQAGADFYGLNTMTAIQALTAIGQNGWALRLSDPVVAQVFLPQPATGWLVLPALLGMAAWRRRSCHRPS